MMLPPLSPDQLVKPRHFELRMALVFAATLMPLGVHLPYFPLWLEGKGFDAAQIAVILSAPMFLRVATTPFITAMADRARDRANVFMALAGSALLISAGYFLEPTYLTVLAVSLALTIALTPQSPLADSLALSGVRRFGSSYPRMRIWGSISFLFGNLGGGIILSLTGADAVPAILSTLFLIMLATSFLAPRIGRPRRASPLSVAEFQAAGPKLLNRTFVLLVVGMGFVAASHGFMYSFLSIYWKSIGLQESLVGFLWAWAVISEVVLFLVFNRLFGRFSAVQVVMIAGLASILRWIVYPFIWSSGLGVAGFLGAQSLHAFSTGLILLGLQKLIAETIPEERTGAAQGIAFFANGFSMAAVTLASGPLYAGLGVYGFLPMAGVAALGLVLILVARSAPEAGLRR